MKPYVKIFSVVICLLILVGALPFTASAYDGEPETIEAVLEIENVATDDEATYDEATYDEATYDEVIYGRLSYATIDELYCATYCSGGVSIPKGVNSSGSANNNDVDVVTSNDTLHLANATEKAKPKEAKTTYTLVYDETTPKSGNNNTKQLKVQNPPIFGNMLIWIISGSALLILGAGTVYFVLMKRKRFNR